MKRSPKKESDLITAKKVLNNKLQQELIYNKKIELQKLTEEYSLKTSDELIDMIFDESGDYSDIEINICRAVLKKRNIEN